MSLASGRIVEAVVRKHPHYLKSHLLCLLVQDGKSLLPGADPVKGKKAKPKGGEPSWSCSKGDLFSVPHGHL